MAEGREKITTGSWDDHLGVVEADWSAFTAAGSRV
jgi:hypothetical protein